MLPVQSVLPIQLLNGSAGENRHNERHIQPLINQAASQANPDTCISFSSTTGCGRISAGFNGDPRSMMHLVPNPEPFRRCTAITAGDDQR